MSGMDAIVGDVVDVGTDVEVGFGGVVSVAVLAAISVAAALVTERWNSRTMASTTRPRSECTVNCGNGRFKDCGFSVDRPIDNYVDQTGRQLNDPGY